MADNLDSIVTVLIYLICAAAFIGMMVVVIISGIKSRMRFANYLRNMNRDEKVQFARKSINFVSVLNSGIAIGILGLLISLVMKQELIAKYISYSFLAFILMMTLVSAFIYRVPKGK